MTALVNYADVAIGEELPPLRVRLERVNLVMYAGASGDYNPIHWNERIATMVGLPNVIAQGMLTMATAGRIVTDWVGDPGEVQSFGVRFSKPVVVPDDDAGTHVQISASVVEKLTDNRVRIDIQATVGDDEVLQQATAVVRLA